MKKKILIIDDDENIITLINTILQEEGYDVISSTNADDGLNRIRKEKPDLILLDLVLPTIGGLEMCQILRKDRETKRIPVIMLTGHAMSPDDKVKGLDTGADDYLTKPFHKGELLSRINALFRRVVRKREVEKILKEGDIIIDRNRHTVFVKDKPIKLMPKEFDLLYLLLKRKGEVLSRSLLAKTVWGQDYTKDTRTIDMTVAHLRNKLGSYGKKIETVEKMGYKFT